MDEIPWPVGLDHKLLGIPVVDVAPLEGLIENSKLMPVILCGQVAPAGVELWCSFRGTGNQGSGRLRADRDVRKGCTDPPKAATPRTRDRRIPDPSGWE